MLWLWHRETLTTVPNCPLLPLGLHCSKGGVQLVRVPIQVQVLQARVSSRLLEPEKLDMALHH